MFIVYSTVEQPFKQISLLIAPAIHLAPDCLSNIKPLTSHKLPTALQRYDMLDTPRQRVVGPVVFEKLNENTYRAFSEDAVIDCNRY